MPLTAEPVAVAPEAVTPVPESWPAEPPLTVIDGRPHWSRADLQELWAFRELLYFLTLRDIKLRYKQTILGVGWSILQPVATMAVFVLFLGRVSGMAEGVDNYALFVLAGLIPWTFFSSAVTNAGNSLIGNERLVTKTYFPRLLLPAANVAAAAFDCLVCTALLVVAVLVGALFGGPPPTWQLLLLPAMAAAVGLTAFGFGSLLSALIATQRDFRYLLNFGMQLWLFATVCIYRRPDLIGLTAQRWLPFNPAYGLILNFRSAVLGTPFDWYALFVSGAVGALVLGFALIYFRRVQQNLADTI